MSTDSPARLKVDLKDQVALVTGASKGIGRGIALAFASSGATVVCVARNPERLAETVGLIQAAGGTAEAVECDVTNSESVNAAVDKIVEKYGKIDVLVNNAGITSDTLLLRMDDKQWDDVISTNLKGMFLFTRAVARPMVQARYGRIINITSVIGFMGNPGQANYAASKAGMIGFTKTVARELGKRKVTVNAVAPGMIQTDMTDILPEMVRTEAKKRIPAARFGAVDEVADAVLFLASPTAAYINGEVLAVDGGLTA